MAATVGLVRYKVPFWRHAHPPGAPGNLVERGFLLSRRSVASLFTVSAASSVESVVWHRRAGPRGLVAGISLAEQLPRRAAVGVLPIPRFRTSPVARTPEGVVATLISHILRLVPRVNSLGRRTTQRGRETRPAAAARNPESAGKRGVGRCRVWTGVRWVCGQDRSRGRGRPRPYRMVV